MKISFQSSEKQQSGVNCIPIAGVHKYGHAGEGLLNLKSQKIILAGLKLLKSLLGFSDRTHPSPYSEGREVAVVALRYGNYDETTELPMKVIT